MKSLRDDLRAQPAERVLRPFRLYQQPVPAVGRETPGRELHFPSRTLVFLEGDEADSIFQILDGVVMLYKLLPDGRRQVVEVLGEGDVFGFSSSPLRDSAAETLAATRCTTYDRAALDRSPALASRLSRRLYSQLSQLHDHAVLLGRKSAMERIASFLMQCVPGRGGYGCTGPRARDDDANIRLTMTRQEIADYLGLTIETVSRSFTKLKSTGVVTISNLDEICIHNVCRLCRLTGTHLTSGRWCSSQGAIKSKAVCAM